MNMNDCEEAHRDSRHCIDMATDYHFVWTLKKGKAEIKILKLKKILVFKYICKYAQ